MHLDGFESVTAQKISRPHWGRDIFGAGDRTRTGTLSPAVDFESTTSTIPSHRQVIFPAHSVGAWPIAVPDIFLGFQKPSSAIDRCPSLRSLFPPQAALPSLPITPAGAKIVYTNFSKIASKKINRPAIAGRFFYTITRRSKQQSRSRWAGSRR